MIRLLGILIVTGAAALLLWLTTPIGFYAKSRDVRLQSLWDQDLQNMGKNQKVKQLFSQIKEHELSFADPQVAQELDAIKLPLQTNPSGRLGLSVEIIRWVDGNSYGYLLQHDVFDITGETPDKIFEFSRNYKIGIFW